MRETLVAFSMVLIMLAVVAVGNAYAEETLFLSSLLRNRLHSSQFGQKKTPIRSDRRFR